MQFYMIDPDAKKSTSRLPDAMIRVNCREGWQIISDIGHHFGLTWQGQNKCYNANHPLTMRLRESREEFDRLHMHYAYSLMEWRRRFGTETVWHEHLSYVPFVKIGERCAATDRWQTMREYILTAKARQIKEGERKRV